MQQPPTLLEVETVDVQLVQWRIYRDLIELSRKAGHRPLSSMEDIRPIVASHSTVKNQSTVISHLAKKGLLKEFLLDGGQRIGAHKSWTVVLTKTVRLGGNIVYHPVPGQAIGEVIDTQPAAAGTTFQEVHANLFALGTVTEHPNIRSLMEAETIASLNHTFGGTTNGGIVSEFQKTRRIRKTKKGFLVLDPSSWEKLSPNEPFPASAVHKPKSGTKIDALWREIWVVATPLTSLPSLVKRVIARTTALQIIADAGNSAMQSGGILGSMVSTGRILRSSEPDELFVTSPDVTTAAEPARAAEQIVATKVKTRDQLERELVALQEEINNTLKVHGQWFSHKTRLEEEVRVAEEAAKLAYHRLEEWLAKPVSEPDTRAQEARAQRLQALIANYDLLIIE